MYPMSCKVCGQSVKSKTQSTHHRRLCRGLMTEKIVAVLTLPGDLQVSLLPSGSISDELSVYASDGRFHVLEKTGSAPVDIESYDKPEDAVGVFLSRREKLRQFA